MGKVISDDEIPEGSLCWYESRNMSARCRLLKSSHTSGVFMATLQIEEILFRTEMAGHYAVGDTFDVSKHDQASHLVGWRLNAKIGE